MNKKDSCFVLFANVLFPSSSKLLQDTVRHCKELIALHAGEASVKSQEHSKLLPSLLIVAHNLLTATAINSDSNNTNNNKSSPTQRDNNTGRFHHHHPGDNHHKKSITEYQEELEQACK